MWIKTSEKALEQLNEREKQIMELRFGLVGEEENTKRCSRHDGDFTILYLPARKADYQKTEKRV